jgi:hypothetical protein
MQKRYSVLLAALVAAPVMAFPNLMGTQWEQVSPKVEGRAPTIAFEPGKMTGFSGCNRYVATTNAEGKTVVAGTRMMCPPPAMQTEAAFLKMLENHPRLMPDGKAQNLKMVAADGITYQFKRVAAAEPAKQPVAGEATAGEQYLYVGPERQSCSAGAGKMECLQVRRSADEQWQNFYGRIDGFEPQPGVSYYIKVRVIPVANPPADASSVRYVLERVVMSQKTERTVTPVN